MRRRWRWVRSFANRKARLSSAIDGASRELEELIQFSTHPEVSSRLDSAKGWRPSKLVSAGVLTERVNQPRCFIRIWRISIAGKSANWRMP